MPTYDNKLLFDSTASDMMIDGMMPCCRLNAHTLTETQLVGPKDDKNRIYIRRALCVVTSLSSLQLRGFPPAVLAAAFFFPSFLSLFLLLPPASSALLRLCLLILLRLRLVVLLRLRLLILLRLHLSYHTTQCHTSMMPKNEAPLPRSRTLP